MSRSATLLLPLVAISGFAATEARAHCFIGARFFPATLGIDDPCVADELSLPTVTWSKTGDEPPARQLTSRRSIPSGSPNILVSPSGPRGRISVSREARA